jgi:hypothetical protein
MPMNMMPSVATRVSQKSGEMFFAELQRHAEKAKAPLTDPHARQRAHV